MTFTVCIMIFLGARVPTDQYIGISKHKDNESVLVTERNYIHHFSCDDDWKTYKFEDVECSKKEYNHSINTRVLMDENENFYYVADLKIIMARLED